MAASPSVDIRYLAGLIDGEGCISIFHDRTQVGKGRVVASRLSIGMTYFPIIKALKKTFGGFLHNHKKREGNRRSLMYWYATEQKAAKVLRRCLPYLKVKKKQAQLLIRLAKSRSKHNSGIYGLSKEIENSRWKIMKECQRLNKRGRNGRNM